MGKKQVVSLILGCSFILSSPVVLGSNKEVVFVTQLVERITPVTVVEEVIVPVQDKKKQAKIDELYTIIDSQPIMQFKGEFRITGYCNEACCTDNWAYNRPQVRGRDVVVTANGSFAEVGITIAADVSVLPYGTTVYIEGIGVRTVQDRGGGVKGKHIDVYFATHEEAIKHGNQFLNVWVLE